MDTSHSRAADSENSVASSQQYSPILLTVRQFAEKHPCFSQASLRNLIFHGKPRKTSRGVIPGNGLEVALKRIGRKILICEEKFFEWVDQQSAV